ncbi:hypothetical protein ACFV2H_51305 [Streptomyces sp. NPDC059629]|uniref:hypothetical protein n=1 Tax=Streptomyces sp. NPDC059629 TaxID=3346889 RepID=UPI0036A6F36F
MGSGPGGDLAVAGGTGGGTDATGTAMVGGGLEEFVSEDSGTTAQLLVPLRRFWHYEYLVYQCNVNYNTAHRHQGFPVPSAPAPWAG